MSVGEVAGLIAAIAFVLLVGALAWPLLKLGRTIDELTATVRLLREETVAKTSTTMDETNTLLMGVNQQVGRLDVVTVNAATASGNVAALSNVVATTVGKPLVKVAAFSYGVRHAVTTGRPNGSRPDGSRRAARGSRA